MAKKRQHLEYECPVCNANNPVEKPIQDGNVFICFYCGCEVQAQLNESGKLVMKEK